MSDAPLLLAGGPAQAPAQLARRLATLGATGVTDAVAHWRYVVDLARPLLDHERARLGELLAATATSDADAAGSCWVVPRLGTISPWSSKATDIVHICGLDAVRRVERAVHWRFRGARIDAPAAHAAVHDRMTETVLLEARALTQLFRHGAPRPMDAISLGSDAAAAIAQVSVDLGLALAEDEIAYLSRRFAELGRAPTDVELMMFAQANSEHCRHKIFNAAYVVDGVPQERSLFQLIRATTAASPTGVLSAYRDNAAVVEGHATARLWPDDDGVYRLRPEVAHILGKVETHNHPTAIAPFAGAATGSGGEIRDEGATGRGGKPKAGLTGFMVSNLRLPHAVEPWEGPSARPGHVASALDIMTDGPLGAAAFNNEFGRPGILGFFRTLELDVDGVTRGYHKPVMLAGGIGNVRPGHVEKAEVLPGSPLVVLGGPAMLIGLGGGAASSVTAGSQRAELDFASVQRDNAEMQRRCQEVIDRCIALGDGTPIRSIHDVGAGGLSNALPELVHDHDRGATIDLRRIPSAEPGLSPRELWCNEAQERYVLALDPARLEVFAALCERERAPWAVVGHATAAEHLRVDDAVLGAPPVDLPLDVIFGKPPRMERRAETLSPARAPLDLAGVTVASALDRVLALPAVADKSFLVTIGDRTVGGLIARDPMVGPCQVPVADHALTLAGFDGHAGEAMAVGERPLVALLDAGASARLAIAEAILNLAGAPIEQLGDIKLSCNWMAAAGHPGEDARLYEAVQAASAFAQALGIAVPVGKDSMSMRMTWQDADGPHAVVSPATLVATAFGPVSDVRRALTPLFPDDDRVSLLWLGPARARPRLGGSALAQAHGQLGAEAPDITAEELRALWNAMQELKALGLPLACHDISDGGVVVAALECAFASNRGGLELHLHATGDELARLFDETPGLLVAVGLPGGADADDGDDDPLQRIATRHGVWRGYVGSVARPDAPGARWPDPGGEPTPHGVRVVTSSSEAASQVLLETTTTALRARWSSVTYAIARLRDDPACADEEHAARLAPVPHAAHVSFDATVDVAAPFVARGARPRVAILREQGVNGQTEMAAAFTHAGFDAVDVHMTDLIAGRHDLRDLRGLAACGGFSFGDVLGAGRGWAMSALHNPRAREALERFFARADTFSLGVCNGCQMMSNLRAIIPGAEAWPQFLPNRSGRFEARLSLLEILPSPSIVFAGMAGSRLPIAVAHGEGRAADNDTVPMAEAHVAARFVDGAGTVASTYPANPNGSPGGATAFTTADGRATILMPHPERVVRTATLSWHPADWGDDSPWLRMFRNARVWVS